MSGMTSSEVHDTGLTNEPETGSGAQESRLTDGPELVQAVQLPFTMLSRLPLSSPSPPLIHHFFHDFFFGLTSTPPETGSPCIRIRDYRPRVRPVKLILCARSFCSPPSSSIEHVRHFSPFSFFSFLSLSLLHLLLSLSLSFLLLLLLNALRLTRPSHFRFSPG